MKNKKTLIIVILALLIVLVLVGTWAFSKYTTDLTGTGSATVAKWSFQSNEGTTTLTTVSLVDTTLNSKVVDGKIAPGTDGTFDIGIDASGSEVAVDYTVEISNLKNCPTNLKFYSDSSFTNEITAVDGVYTVEGSIALAAVDTAVTVPIYWQWPYETTDGDGIDTTEGEAAATMTFDVKVTGTQADPRS